MSSKLNPDSTESELAKVGENLLKLVGEDLSRPGVVETPDRFARAMLEITSGYREDLDTIVNGAIFEEESSEMVVVKNVEFYSLCEHHCLPFFGRVHLAYIPSGRIIGLSKVPRIISLYSKRLQVQERLTGQIATTIEELLQPKGLACMIEAYHFCMMMRGVKVQSSSITTTAMRGFFSKDTGLRSDFLRIVNSGSEFHG